MGFSSPSVGHQRAAERPAGEMVAENLPGREPLLAQARKLRFYNDENGFFILDTVPAGALPPVPPELSEYAAQLARGVVVKGSSMVFREGDQTGNTLSCHGRWVIDPTHGIQFEALYVLEILPSNLEGLRKYLSAGRLKGIGPATASLIVEKWGMDTLRILDKEPGALAQIPGINQDKALMIGEVWRTRRDNFEVVAFFGEYGIGEQMALRILDAMGKEGLLDRVRQNPYAMTEVEGVGFKTADQMALALGFALDSKVRIEAALKHVLHERVQQGGNTAVPLEEWKRLSAMYLDYPVSHIEPFCAQLIKTHKVSSRVLNASLSPGASPVLVDCVSPMVTAATENTIAKHMHRLQNAAIPADPAKIARLIHGLEDPKANLDPSQKAAAWTLMANPISIMTGGPGTGKTTTLRTVVRLLQETGARVVLAAPTGRAAKRMEEAVGVEAMTMHRRLRFNPAGGFAHHEGNPMSGDVFVLDETSMVDSSLGCGWLRAIPSGSRVVFVGDVDQLPSVGPGDVLRDLINSGRIPVARLTKVHRQAEGSGIAQAAQAILAGRAPVSNDIAGNDFSFIKSEDNASIIRDLEKLIRHQLACGFSHKDIQILCPQKTGDVGTDALNNRLRWLLNPTSPNQHDEDLLVSTRGWCLGERLMQTKNNYELSVFNGDMGTVTDISGDGGLTLEMEDSRPVIYPKQATKDLTMGYAITVHKSQGGERPVILMPISPSHTFSLNRNLLYTGITRGKKQVCLVGSPRTAVVAAGKKDQTARLTGLVHEIDHVYESVGLKARRKPKSGFQPS